MTHPIPSLLLHLNNSPTPPPPQQQLKSYQLPPSYRPQLKKKYNSRPPKTPVLRKTKEKTGVAHILVRLKVLPRVHPKVQKAPFYSSSQIPSIQLTLPNLSLPKLHQPELNS
ncbi:hypothetical protein M758_8G165200 [Ceratodon purpureus]|nr:hypothetical protein M758_8G165200 [Ceratodon purpureus]